MTRSELAPLEDGRSLVSAIETHAPPLRPDRCGSVEPLRQRFAKDGLAACWDGKSFMWRVARRAGEGHVIKRVWERDTHAFVLMSADSARVRPQILSPLLEDLACRFGGDYGFLHLFTPADLGKSGPNEPFGDGEDPFLMPTPAELRRCLPALFWGNVFGPAYVELFDEATLRAAPAARVVELAESTYYLQVTDHISDLRHDYEAFDARRRAVVDHLGCDCFWDPDAGFGRRYRAPPVGERRPEGQADQQPRVEQAADVVQRLTRYAWDALREDGHVEPTALAVTEDGRAQVIGADATDPAEAIASIEDGVRVFGAEHPIVVAALVYLREGSHSSELLVHVEVDAQAPFAVSRPVRTDGNTVSLGRPTSEPASPRLRT